jgi:N-hydroxyarylamine O-acetyltransferase
MKMESAAAAALSESLVERVLARLGLSARPEPTLQGLAVLYGAWCQRVPFDNVRKMIHVRSGDAGPLPGSPPEDFLTNWLKHGTGGTCWSGAGSFQALLAALGFAAVRGVATMLVVPDLPPNHGTVQVSFGTERYLVDCSMLHGEPLRLDEQAETRVTHPGWGLRCGRRDGRWHVAWRPLHKVDGFECRLERFGASAEEFRHFYEQTRGWSPFNYEVSARINRGDKVVGMGFGQAVTLRADGSVEQRPISRAERDRVLIEEVGLSEEIVAQLPDDTPTPPPPGSRTAQEAGEK